MATKRLNIMLYSETTGEQIVLPINPKSIEIKYEKSFNSYEIIGFGEVNIMAYQKPLKITLSHFLPEDNSVFKTYSGITYYSNKNSTYIEDEFSLEKAVSILTKWTQGQTKIRLVIDDEISIDCMVASFSQTIRESISSKPYILELLEYRNPTYKIISSNGLITRNNSLNLPSFILMTSKDTVYSIADKYGLDYKTLAKNNGIDDPNANIEGIKLQTQGGKSWNEILHRWQWDKNRKCQCNNKGLPQPYFQKCKVFIYL